MEALSYRGVEKNFGEVKAVRPLDLDIPQGAIFGLLGPNGAGKSTLIRMTMGIYLPDQGAIEVLGRSRTETTSSILGYLPEERGLYTKMKVGELLRFFACLRGLSSAEASRRASKGLKRVGLEKWENNKVDELSKGMQQKIQLLVAIQHVPKIAILDEPFSGLDPVNTELFMEMLDEAVGEGMTVVLSTHQMEQVEKLCHSIALVNEGRVVLKGNVGDIRKRYGARAVRVEFSDGAALSPADFESLAEQALIHPNEARFFLRPGVHAGKILKRLLDMGVKVSKFEEAQASMHDIFVKVVTGGTPEGNLRPRRALPARDGRETAMRTNWGNIYAVIRREFLERVRKKSFLITTLITPLIFGALMIVPAFLQVMQTGKPTEILVVDRTGWAGPAVIAASPKPRHEANSIESKAEQSAMNAATLKMAPDSADLEAIKRDIGDGKVDGALLLESDDSADLKATYFGQNISNPQLFQMFNSRLNMVLVEHRLDKLGLDRAIADKLKGRVDVDPIKVEKGGKTRKGSIMDFLVPIALAMVIYMMILMYGVAIMNGVLEEKNSKVVEVILSAVRPFELMMGKIVGIASVGLLQYGIWFIVGTSLYMANPMNFQSHMEGSPVKVLQLVLLVLYFLLGFIFYSSLYAAIGAACTTQQETQQWQMPVTFGLIIPFVLMMPTLMTPNASWVVALSLFPVTSPITMLLRVGAVEVPLWQIAASLGLLALGTVVVAWAAAKVYRVGVLMTGKRPSIPEILRWIREK